MRRGWCRAIVLAIAVCVGTPLAASAQPDAAPTTGQRMRAFAADVAARHATAAHGVSRGTDDATTTGTTGTTTATALAATTVTASANATPTMNVSDPTGDVPFSSGDITKAGFGANATSYVFALNVKSPVDPATDVNWQNGLAFAGWALDANSDDFAEHIVIFVGTGRGGAALLDGITGEFCDGTGVFVPGVGYRARFRQGCPASVSTFRWQAGMLYTDDPNDVNPPFDMAPDDGWRSAVMRDPLVRSGYWMLGADGSVYAFGDAKQFTGTVPFATAMAPRRDGSGYWVVDAVGGVHPYGTAHHHGDHPPLLPGELISTISATRTGDGYWLFSNRGRAFPYGDAFHFGDMSGTILNGPIISSVATPTGRGYYMVASDGGIFAFGDAAFHGSMGGVPLNRPVVGLSPTPSNGGYWLVASDGGVFAFDAPFRGSMGGVALNRPVTGLVAFGTGYLMVASDGGVFNFSDRAFVGSLADTPLPAPIVGVAAFTQVV